MTFSPSHTTSTKTSSFSTWMEVWIIYLAVSHASARAPQLVACQSSASNQYSLKPWLNYDISFHTLVASNPSLWWDVRYRFVARMLFWYSCPYDPLACVRCGATIHYSEIVFFMPNLCMNLEEDLTHYPPQHPLEDSTHHPCQVTYPTLDNPVTVDQPCHSQAVNSHNRPATPSIVQSAVDLPATSYTCVKYVVPTTVSGSALTRTVPLSKPTPWTLLR